MDGWLGYIYICITDSTYYKSTASGANNGKYLFLRVILSPSQIAKSLRDWLNECDVIMQPLKEPQGFLSLIPACQGASSLMVSARWLNDTMVE